MSQGKITEQPGTVGVWTAEIQPDREAVREQLERLLADPLFKHSRRYPSLLRYIVERTLEGRTEKLKERTLGVEVFGREPGYDTNADPVVRTAAGAIRKRIAQYYHEPGREHELRIDLPTGSYVPEFRFAVPVQASAAAAPAHGPATAKAPHRAGHLGWLLVVGVALAAVSFAIPKEWPRDTALDRFWKPVLEAPGQVLLCIGQPRQPAPPPQSDTPLTVSELHFRANQNVALSDALTLSRLVGILQARGKAYRVRGETFTNFADLRDGPVILIGAFNNDWTQRVTAPLRFAFDRDPSTGMHWITDRRKPSVRAWAVNMRTPYASLSEDYAIVARVLDPTTERLVVVAAGVEKDGTVAAGEFLTNPVFMEQMARLAPAGWESKNIEIVIATKVINGNSGPPRVLAVNVW